MKSDIFNFFDQQTNEYSLTILKNCILDQIKIQVVQENQVKVFSSFLDNKFSAKKFYLSIDARALDLTQKYSFCIKMNSKVYFFKSQIFEDTKGIYFKDDICIYELRRRKDTRFELPLGWKQSCSIYAQMKKGLRLEARVLNISWSGIRLEVVPPFSEFLMNQEIQFSLQVHRRAELLCHGVIKYVKNNKNSGPVLGIEFINKSRLFDSKIQNICEDLLRYFILKQKNLT